ncbi:MAG: hypothetical protein JXR83_19215, partial [Deltaproteobacteria bacterium]|nr:hypothetical protein [Deltaproteobacteria bacterium]
PVPKADVAKLFGDSQWGRLLRTNLDTASVDLSQQPAVEAFLTKAAAAGATAFDLRQVIARMNGQPQQQLQALAQKHGLVAEVPVLRASLDKMVALANGYLRSQYLQVGDNTREFLKAVGSSRNLTEMTSFVQTLSRNAEDVIAREAQRLNIAAPKLDYDFNAIDAYLKQTITSVRVEYNAELAKFVREAVAAGVPVAMLQRALASLNNNTILATALKSANIYVAGIQLPTIKYDLAATESWVRSGLINFQSVVPSGTQLTDFCKACMDQGMSPTHVYNFATYSLTSGRQRASSYANGVPLASLPPVPIDVDAVCQYWQGRLGANWKPEMTAYVKSALPKALENPSFALYSIFNSNASSILTTLQNCSGIPRPAGV